MPPWNWSHWSECTNPCGGDSQRRFRSCRGQNCLYPADSQTRECMPKQCSKKHILNIISELFSRELVSYLGSEECSDHLFLKNSVCGHFHIKGGNCLNLSQK